MGFLSEKNAEVRRALEIAPLDESSLMARAVMMPPARDFAAALDKSAQGEPGSMSAIAEVKRASPSTGGIAGEPDPAGRARAYEEAGAAAISVLTDAKHFDGSLADLQAVHLATQIPVLRKDFLVHPSQLMQARASGADAVLLITAMLSPSELEGMQAAAGDLGLGVLVEVHSDQDLSRALSAQAPVLGVNARDLETLEVDFDRAIAMLERIPEDRLCVLESGVSTREHVERAQSAGASAVLIGESLMRAADPGAKLRELLGKAAA